MYDDGPSDDVIHASLIQGEQGVHLVDLGVAGGAKEGDVPGGEDVAEVAGVVLVVTATTEDWQLEERFRCVDWDAASSPVVDLAVATLPPTWSGLKCPPAALQSSLVSPTEWTWKPWKPGARPFTSPLIRR